MRVVPQGVHAQRDVHSGAVGEEGGESGLNKQAEDQDPVPVERLKKNKSKTRGGVRGGAGSGIINGSG